MANFIAKKLHAMRLQAELEELEKNSENKKEVDLFNELTKLLKKYDLSLEELQSFINAALGDFDSVTEGRGRPKGTKYKSVYITYNGVEYKVNSAGRQQQATKDLLDELELSPTEFIEQNS